MGQKKMNNVRVIIVCSVITLLGCSSLRGIESGNSQNKKVDYANEVFKWKSCIYQDTSQIARDYDGFNCAFSIEGKDFYAVVDNVGSGVYYYAFHIFRHEEIGWIKLYCTNYNMIQGGLPFDLEIDNELRVVSFCHNSRKITNLPFDWLIK